jgi:glycosyltransferase domain-containing protein
MLNQLTIIIITYKRYGFLKRLLIFFSSYQLKAKILVLDSSPDHPKDERLIELLSHKNLSWKKYDSDIFFAHKIAEGCKHIQTEYAVLCAVDDFLIPHALERCIDFLSEHQDYASAHGLYFNHSSYEKTRSNNFRIDPLYEQGQSSEEKTSAERVTAYLGGKTRNYPMYAVHRSSTFRLIWSETKKYVSDEGLSELFPCCLSFSYGKMKIIPMFYNSREPNNYDWYTIDTQSEWYNKIYSKDKLKHAVIGLSKHLSKLDRLSLEEAENVSQNSFQDYLKRATQNLNYQKSFKNKLSFLFLNRFKQKLRIPRRILGWIYLICYQGCHPSIYPEHLDDFKRVRGAVLSAGLNSEELNKSRKELTKQLKGKV